MGDRRGRLRRCACCATGSTLDSGYLSRLLRSLEADGLVTVGPSERDRRARTARLTPRAGASGPMLDRRSDRLACPCSRRSTTRSAAGSSRRWTRSSGSSPPALVEIEVVDPAHRHAQHCLREYFAELDRRFEAGFDPDVTLPAGPDECARRPACSSSPPSAASRSAAGRSGSTAAPAGRDQAHVGRRTGAGLGVGRRLLAELEAPAAASGIRPSGSTRTRPSPRRSPCTARPATARSTRSTTSPTRTTGSRSASQRP